MAGRLTVTAALAFVAAVSAQDSSAYAAGSAEADASADWEKWAATAHASSTSYTAVDGWISPPYTWQYEFELPIPAVAQPLTYESLTITNPRQPF